jgi:hypothetical protein
MPLSCGHIRGLLAGLIAGVVTFLIANVCDCGRTVRPAVDFYRNRRSVRRGGAAATAQMVAPHHFLRARVPASGRDGHQDQDLHQPFNAP